MPITDPDLAAQVRYWKSVKGGVACAARKTQAEQNAAMERAREGLYRSLARKVDPTGELAANDPDELARRVDLARRAQLAEASYKAALARAQRRQEAAAAEADAA